MQNLWGVARRMELSFLICKGIMNFPDSDDRLTGNIDIWWVVDDGRLLLLIAHLLRHSAVWKECTTRLFVLSHQEDYEKDLEEEIRFYLQFLRLQVGEIIVVSVDIRKSRGKIPISMSSWKLRALDMAKAMEDELENEARGLGSSSPFDFHRDNTADQEHFRGSNLIKLLKNEIKRHSSDSAVVILNLPQPDEEDWDSSTKQTAVRKSLSLIRRLSL